MSLDCQTSSISVPGVLSTESEDKDDSESKHDGDAGAGAEVPPRCSIPLRNVAGGPAYW